MYSTFRPSFCMFTQVDGHEYVSQMLPALKSASMSACELQKLRTAGLASMNLALTASISSSVMFHGSAAPIAKPPMAIMSKPLSYQEILPSYVLSNSRFHDGSGPGSTSSER
jgi:hypothetical protein